MRLQASLLLLLLLVAAAVAAGAAAAAAAAVAAPSLRCTYTRSYRGSLRAPGVQGPSRGCLSFLRLGAPVSRASLATRGLPRCASRGPSLGAPQQEQQQQGALKGAGEGEDVRQWLEKQFKGALRGYDLCLLLPRGSTEAEALSLSLGEGGPFEGLASGGSSDGPPCAFLPGGGEGQGPRKGGTNPEGPPNEEPLGKFKGGPLEEAPLWVARWPADSPEAAGLLQRYLMCQQQQLQYPARPPVVYLQPRGLPSGAAAAAPPAGGGGGAPCLRGPLGAEWRCSNSTENLGAPLAWGPSLVPPSFPVKSKLQPQKLSLILALLAAEAPPAAPPAAPAAAAGVARSDGPISVEGASLKATGNAPAAAAATATATAAAAAAAPAEPAAAAAAAIASRDASSAFGHGFGLGYCLLYPPLSLHHCTSMARLVHGGPLADAAGGVPIPKGPLKALEKTLGLQLSKSLRLKMLAEVRFLQIRV